MPTHPRRLAMPVVLAGLLIALAAPGVAAAGPTFPTQSLNNRGVDVRAIQGLLIHHGQPVAIDGVFGTATQDAVKAFQGTQGLTVDGVVGEATWGRLAVSLGPGSSGEAVKVLQRLLNEKRKAGLTVNGVYGAATRNAVIAFRRHMGMTARDRVGPLTWRKLAWHYDKPGFKGNGLCDYSVGNGAANWATGAAIGQLEAATRAFSALGRGRVPVGDASREHGGDIAGHQSHEVGLDIDLRPMRDAEDQCTWGTNWRSSSYNRPATRALIKAIRAAAPGHVKVIFFNDPVLIDEGLTRWFSGHDDHLHVRYCERWHELKRYRC